MFPALKGKFLTTGPQGRSPYQIFFSTSYYSYFARYEELVIFLLYFHSVSLLTFEIEISYYVGLLDTLL